MPIYVLMSTSDPQWQNLPNLGNVPPMPKNKNKNVLKPNYSSENKNYDLFSGLIFGKYKYDDIIDDQDYLN